MTRTVTEGQVERGALDDDGAEGALERDVLVAGAGVLDAAVDEGSAEADDVGGDGGRVDGAALLAEPAGREVHPASAAAVATMAAAVVTARRQDAAVNGRPAGRSSTAGC